MEIQHVDGRARPDCGSGFGNRIRSIRAGKDHKSTRSYGDRVLGRPIQAEHIAEPQVDPATGKRPAMGVDNPTSKPKWLSGGGGMISTAKDYVQFCQMLLNGGELDGIRLLSPKTVALMTSDHLPPGVKYKFGFIALVQDIAPTPEMGEGFGLGFLVRKDVGHNPLPGPVNCLGGRIQNLFLGGSREAGHPDRPDGLDKGIGQEHP